MSARDRTDGEGTVTSSGGVVVTLVVVALVVAGVAAVGLALVGLDLPGDPGTGATPGGTVDGHTPSGTATNTGTAGATPAKGTPAPLPPGDSLEGTTSLADADVTIEGQGADEFGYATAVGDVNGDGTPDLVVGAPFHNATATRSGAVFVFYGPVAPGNLTIDDADLRLEGESNGDWAGNTVAVGDVTGDGVGDLVLGAPRQDGGANNAGAIYVVHGGPDLGGTVDLGSADAKLTGTIPDSLGGFSVDVGDVTGDATTDVVVGVPRGDEEPGRVLVVDGRSIEASGSLADATATLVGERPGDEAGSRVAVGRNLTGNGGPALVVGAPRNDAAGENAGAAYVVAGPFDGRASLGDAAIVRRGPEAGAFAGFSVAAPGDVDGDGQPEALVGAPFAGPGGAAFVVDADAGERSLDEATALRGAAPGDRAGWVVDGTADLTCDGRPDVLVGAPRNDAGGENAGAVYVAGGDGEIDLANASAALVGAAPDDQVGRADAVATVPGENTTGLLVGAPFGEAPPTAHVVYAACPEG